MSRVRNIVDRFSKAARNGTIDSDGSINISSAINVVTATDDAGLLGLDTSSHTDGSLHYRTFDHATYVYDDSEDKYYPLTVSSSALALPWSIYGQVSGYASGGEGTIVIDKFSFAADGNSTDVGDLVFRTNDNGGGHSSVSHGYNAGGASSTPNMDLIQKFSFASDGNAANTGANLTYEMYGHSSSDTEDYGYLHGHAHQGPGTNIIQRFSFSSDTNAENVGSASADLLYAAGYTSNDYGYAAGGWMDVYQSQPNDAEIVRYPFAASGANSAVVGTLHTGLMHSGGVSDPDNGYGYHCGGHDFPPTAATNQIQRFSFSSSSTATDHSDLAIAVLRVSSSGTQSNTSGYIQGAAWDLNYIQKFPFANNSTGTDVGDLTVGRANPASHQK